MSTKESWPELVGKTGEEAKAIISKERPDLTKVDVLKENSPVTKDHRVTRVRIFVDDHQKVSKAPHTG
jgi:hypothetical protein